MKKLAAVFMILIIPGVAPLWCQVSLVAQPAPGFAERIRAAVNAVRIIDTHEHLVTEEQRIAMAGNLDFTYLFQHYAKEDLISASNAPGVIQLVFGQSFPLQQRWDLFAPYYDAMRTTAYGRVPLIAARDLYGITDINENTFQALSDSVRSASVAGLYRRVLKDKAGIDLSILDDGHARFDPEFYRHVERFDNFINVSSAVQIRELCSGQHLQAGSLDDFVRALRHAFEQGVAYGMVGVKSALAYQRILKYDNIAKERAAQLFLSLMSGEAMTVESLKALQDYMMHRVLDLADEFDLPVQIHTGMQAGNGNMITNSNPTHLANLFMEYPDVDFCLFHGGYPYGGELATLAKNFPNVYIDMCWTHIISPSYSQRYLHEWLETVPSNKILAFGGDYSVVECVYGHAVIARENVARVLVDKVSSGYMTEEEAINIARRILRDNALEVFHLQGKSRGVENLAVLHKPGPLRDWWDIHKTNDGFVRRWRIIGPFPSGGGLDQPLPPESEINFTKTYAGVSGEVNWVEAATPPSGYLNLRSEFSRKAQFAHSDFIGMAYAYAEVRSPDDRRVTLTLGSNDGAKMWLNGEVVYNKSLGRNAIADQDFLQVDLKQGVNTILVKVENLGANWGLYLRLVDPNRELSIAGE